jgi:hypothetical protein
MEKSLCTIAEVMPEKLNAMVKIVMNQMGITDPNEAVRRINSREWIVSEAVRRWYEQNGVIRFTLPPTTGMTGPQWCEHFGKRGICIGDEAKFVLHSDAFKPTKDVVNEIAVLKGVLFRDNKRITKHIRAGAYAGEFTGGQKLCDPHAEVACLIRDLFTDGEIEAMGLRWILVMHKPIENSGGGPRLLSADRYDDGPWMGAACARSDGQWSRAGGFAFVASQVGALDSVTQDQSSETQS